MKNRWQSFLGLLAAWMLVGVAMAADDLPVGKSDFVFVDQRGNADKPIRVWVYRPAVSRVIADSVGLGRWVMRNLLTNSRTIN